jgi:phosphatidylserine/phosphatidylglycerophosphate/cardiolipin synthase-like enzyme
MNDAFTKLSTIDLQTVIAALRSGRLCSPYTGLQVARFVPVAISGFVRTAFLELEASGFSGEQIATALSLVAADRMCGRTNELTIDLVTTGPEAPGISNRDTSVVVRELFAHAKQSVLVVGYAVFQGQQVFRALADRMVEHPDLEVRLFLDIKRGQGDTTAADQLVRQFAHEFRAKMWPADRPLPAVFYDPRSLSLNKFKRTSLHAKCVVVDRQVVFVSSANFTEAAQERNIEVGLLSRSATLAERVSGHFESLVTTGALLRIPP